MSTAVQFTITWLCKACFACLQMKRFDLFFSLCQEKGLYRIAACSFLQHPMLQPTRIILPCPEVHENLLGQCPPAGRSLYLIMPTALHSPRERRMTAMMRKWLYARRMVRAKVECWMRKVIAFRQIVLALQISLLINERAKLKSWFFLKNLFFRLLTGK